MSTPQAIARICNPATVRSGAPHTVSTSAGGPSDPKASGYTHRSFRPDAVRYMSVTTAMHRPAVTHADTRRDEKETARRAAFPQPAGRFRRWWQVLGSNQRRLSRRFYIPLLPAPFNASELRKHCQITFVIGRCPLTCIAT